MKRFHVHVGVDDLDKNIAFYSSMFGQAPTVVKADYAKWMLDDPRINFAISNRGLPNGVDHLGFQTETADELAALRTQTAQADLAARDDGVTTCCYSKSDKYWITDPQGIAWETFHTLDSIPVFSSTVKTASACCAPTMQAPVSTPASQAVAMPTIKAAAKSACC